MIYTRCSGGGACFCPVLPAHDADCFIIWGWAVLSVFVLTAVTFSIWYVWSTFLKPLPLVNAAERLQRQKTFWVLSFSFTVVQILMALTLHSDDPIQLAAWVAMMAVLVVWFCAWSARRKRG